jgi:transposase-like protein
MKRKRYTEEQIAFALRQAENGTSVAKIVRKLGITEQTFYRWRKKYGVRAPSGGYSSLTLPRVAHRLC